MIVITQENAMPYKLPTGAPFDVRGPWLYTSSGAQVRIVARTRRHITVATAKGSVQLSRRALERTGQDISGGMTYRTTKYWLPMEAQEQTA